MRFENLIVEFENDSVSIPVFRFGKLNSSKRLVVLGGVHGNEINGICILKKIINLLSDSLLESNLDCEIICLPVVNVLGFHNFTRRFKNKDLNRSYTDNPINFAEHICFEIFQKFIKNATYVLDFHDSGSNYELLLHSRIAPNNQLLLDMTSAMGIEFTLVRKPQTGMLAEYALKRGVLVLTVESGGGGVVHDTYIENLLTGFKNFLNKFELLKESKLPLKTKKLDLIELKTRFKYRLDTTSIIKYHVVLGQKIKKSDLLCTIYQPSTASEFNLYSKKDGYLFSLPSKNIVTSKQVICDIALDCCDYNIISNPEIFELVKVI